MVNEVPLFDAATHTYRNAQGSIVPSVTQILARAGICDFSFVEEEIRIRSMERGTSVHWLTQLEDEGVLDYRKVPLRLRPYRKAWNGFKRATGFVPELIEKQFISIYGFAGTIDRFGHFPSTASYGKGSHGIVDIKSGEIMDWVRYQLAAYTMHCSSNPAIACCVRRVAVALRADGTYQVKEFPRDTWGVDFAKFMQAKKETDAGHVDHDRAAN